MKMSKTTSIDSSQGNKSSSQSNMNWTSTELCATRQVELVRRIEMAIVGEKSKWRNFFAGGLLPKVDTKVVSDSGFVPWQHVNQILGYKLTYNMRGFGGGSGLKKISAEQYAQLVNLFDDSEKDPTTPDKSRFVIDESGNRVAVILAIQDYEKLLEELEELDSIRAYDAAKASGDEAIPLEEAIDEIERG